MRCKNCGQEIPNNSNFCAICGKPVDYNDYFDSSASDESNKDNYYQQQQRYRYREEPLHPGRASIGWLFLGFFLPIAGWILGYILAARMPDAAYKCRRGAFFGFISYLIIVLMEVLVQFMR